MSRASAQQESRPLLCSDSPRHEPRGGDTSGGGGSLDGTRHGRFLAGAQPSTPLAGSSFPSRSRDQLGVQAGGILELTVRDGRLEIEIAPLEMRLESGPHGLVAVPAASPGTLTADLRTARRRISSVTSWPLVSRTRTSRQTARRTARSFPGWSNSASHGPLLGGVAAHAVGNGLARNCNSGEGSSQEEQKRTHCQGPEHRTPTTGNCTYLSQGRCRSLVTLDHAPRHYGVEPGLRTAATSTTPL